MTGKRALKTASTGRGHLKSAQFEAVVTRAADGTVENHGVVSYWHRNPLRRWHWRVTQWLRGSFAGRISITRSNT